MLINTLPLVEKVLRVFHARSRMHPLEKHINPVGTVGEGTFQDSLILYIYSILPYRISPIKLLCLSKSKMLSSCETCTCDAIRLFGL